MQVDLIVFLTLLSAGYVFGRYNERRHFASIREREQALKRVLVFTERLPPPRADRVEVALVAGSCAISFDYFKTFVAGLRNLFGGRVTSYESLLDRARREAVLRMKEEAARLGADMVINVRLETASTSGEQAGATGAVEVFAYGTALYPKRIAS